MNKINPIKFMKASPVFMIVVIFILTLNVQGQCKNFIFENSVFDNVTNEYRSVLENRLTKFLNFKSEEKFEELYEMITPSFRELNKKEDFIKDVSPYYAGNNKFISFNTGRIDEYISHVDKMAVIWFVQGCWTEFIDNKKLSVKIVFEIQHENNEIFLFRYYDSS